MHNARILIVEDEGIVALDIQQMLKGLGFAAIDSASTGEEAIEKAYDINPDLVLMDIMLGGEIDGITAAERIKECFDIPIIYITAYADETTLHRAKLTEPYGYIVKPFKEKELHITIDMALYKHKMQKKLKESQKWLSTTLNSIGDAVITADNNGIITFINPVAQQLTGRKEEEAIGKKLAEVFNIINKDTRKPVENPAEKVLMDGITRGLGNHTILISNDGTETPIDDSAAPIKDSNGNILGVILVFRDITEREKAEQERETMIKALKESEERYRKIAKDLQEADERKNEFLAVLSHELRNPLTTISNSLQILEQATPGKDQAIRAQNVIKRQIRQLSRLVDDLLDITRITQNRIELKKKRFDLIELVRRTVEDHRPVFQKNGLYLEAELPSCAVFINADEARIMQVIGNLLHNAAKFTDKGGRTRVFVNCDASQKQAAIHVVDSGIGLEPDMLSSIFEPFVQAPKTLDRSYGGLGLGLALSKVLIEMHGGTISARSEGLGKGSEFIVHLPIEDTLKDNVQVTPNVSVNARKILVIDDIVDLADTLGELLEFKNYQVAVAYSGPEGLVKAREFLPEIVLCDIGLPKMDGYEVARAFRADAKLKNVFMVALSGYAMPRDVKQAADAGFNYHLAKPVELDTLEQIISQVPVRI